MKLVSFVLLGVAASIAVSQLIMTCFLRAFPGAEQALATIFFVLLILMPVSLLLGSIVTGFLSYTAVETKWVLLGMAPGLYVGIIYCLLMMSVFGLVFWLFYYIVSLAGVGLGYFLRACIRRYRFGRPD